MSDSTFTQSPLQIISPNLDETSSTPYTASYTEQLVWKFDTTVIAPIGMGPSNFVFTSK